MGLLVHQWLQVAWVWRCHFIGGVPHFIIQYSKFINSLPITIGTQFTTSQFKQLRYRIMNGGL